MKLAIESESAVNAVKKKSATKVDKLTEAFDVRHINVDRKSA